MQPLHRLKLGLVGVIAATLAGTTLVSGPAQAADSHHVAGHRSLATVLAADKGYDHNWTDFNILQKAVTAVLTAKPNSPVGALTHGRTRLTAFIPTDGAFRRLVHHLTGHTPRTERGTFRALTRVADVNTLETVLLYHVIPGRTLGAAKVAKLGGRTLTTASGGRITVRVHGTNIVLVDGDHKARNPRVVAVNINKGNRQIAHAINRVLLPTNL